MQKINVLIQCKKYHGIYLAIIIEILLKIVYDPMQIYYNTCEVDTNHRKHCKLESVIQRVVLHTHAAYEPAQKNVVDCR